MRFGIVSLFPELGRAVGGIGVIGRALESGQAGVEWENPRDHAEDRHRSVDDRPYGGGPGMVMQPGPMRSAIRALRSRMPAGALTAYLSPQGRPFSQAQARAFSALPGLILVCGRYEGVDERLLESEIDEEISVGDFVVSGGELPAMMVMDAVIRLLPGVLGGEQSAEQDSFVEGLLDCPHYTRPEDFEGLRVPPVLLSGDHERIRRWRLKQALGRTWQRRPDLLRGRLLSEEEQGLLDEFIAGLNMPVGTDKA